jgi:hypothetical protein
MIGASIRKNTQATEAQIAARAKMAVADYRKYLAENVLNECRTVCEIRVVL